MAHRPDCPIDMIGLTSYDRAIVMAARPDCPIDLTGLNGPERVSQIDRTIGHVRYYIGAVE